MAHRAFTEERDDTTIVPGLSSLKDQPEFAPALPQDRQASGAISALLSGAELNRKWALYNASEKNHNPAHEIANTLNADEEAAVLHDPAFLRFAIEFVAAHRKALGKASGKDDPALTEMRQGLEGLQAVLEEKADGLDLPARRKLPEEQRQILNIVERQTGQAKQLLMKGIWKLHVDGFKHIGQQFKNTPLWSSTLMAGSMGLLWFIHKNFANAAQSIEPDLADMSFEDLAPLGEETTFVSELDSYDTSVKMCHDHLQVFLPPDAAQKVSGYLVDNFGTSVSQHCVGFYTGIKDAQQNVEWVVDTVINSRITAFIEKPIAALGDNALENTAWMQGFNEQIIPHSDYVKYFNTIENSVVHLPITWMAFMGLVTAGSLSKADWQNLKNETSDFFSRTMRTRPLAYAGMAAAGAAEYINGFHASSVVPILMASLAGYSAHSIHRRLKSKKTGLEFAKAAKIELQDFQANAEAFDPARKGALKSKWKQYTKAGLIGGLTAAGMADAALLYGDMMGYIAQMDNETLKSLASSASHMAGGATAAAMMWGGFAAYNVPEDTVMHGFFGIVGAIFALPVMMVQMAAKMTKKAGHYLSSSFKAAAQAAPAPCAFDPADSTPPEVEPLEPQEFERPIEKQPHANTPIL